jgi:hypothetical protein
LKDLKAQFKKPGDDGSSFGSDSDFEPDAIIKKQLSKIVSDKSEMSGEESADVGDEGTDQQVRDLKTKPIHRAKT